jgi:hypothetical protein
VPEKPMPDDAGSSEQNNSEIVIQRLQEIDILSKEQTKYRRKAKSLQMTVGGSVKFSLP